MSDLFGTQIFGLLSHMINSVFSLVCFQAVESGELSLTPDFYKKIWNEWLKSNR